MANHPEGANRYIISKTWAEVMQPSPAKGEAEAYHLPLMVRATQPETAHFGEAAANGGGMEPFHYTVEGRVSSARPPARKPSDNDYVGDDYDGKPTKTMIAHMPRATLLEWLPGATGTVAELRAQLRDQLYPGV